MWAIRNETPFAAERTLLRDPRGREVWTVAVKATFDVGPDGQARPAALQRPVARAPHFVEIRGAPMLLSDADLGAPKPATDVLVFGHAHAPEGGETREIEISLAVGPLRKALVVTGDRVWEGDKTLSLSRPTPFSRMPLTYERAFGGADPAGGEPAPFDARNPVGRGFVADPSRARGQAAPNIELPEHRLAQPNDRPPPGGFGPIAPSWSPRVALAGTHDDAWARTRHPLPPEDLRPSFHNVAPADQQVTGHLRGGEPVRLTHLTPSGEWHFALPRLALAFETRFGDRSEKHAALLSTVALFPDDEQVVMTFATHLPCHGRDHLLRETLIAQKTIVPLGSGPPARISAAHLKAQART